MKDSSILHKFNKKLLLAVVLIIILVFTATIFLNRKKETVEPPAKEEKSAATEKPAENIDFKADDLNIVKAVKEVEASDHLWGEISAPVKIIVYDDFENPFSADFTQTLKRVKEEFGAKTVIAFRHYPLTSIHPYAMLAAEAAECAADEGKFWEMHDKLFADNLADKMGAEQFKKDAADLGLAEVKFNQCLETEKHKEKIEAQMIEGKNANVNGTPTVFVNGEILPGAYPLEDFTSPDGVKTEGLRSVINRHLGNSK